MYRTPRMFVSLPSAALYGVEAYRVDVEVDVGGGLPAYNVVGLPTTSVKEGATRIRSALRNCGQDMPPRKVTVNLAPADRRKDGAAFDLPIAVGIVIAAGLFRWDALAGLMLMGELGLDGSVRAVRGALAAATLARRLGLRGIVVPEDSAAEAALVSGLTVYPVRHLAQVLRAMDGNEPLETAACWRAPAEDALEVQHDFVDVRGQPMPRRALEIAIAGGHNVLLYGPPGTGKTMLARCVPSILPPMTEDECLEVTNVYSAAGLSPSTGMLVRRPFRSPHHTVSVAGLVGGGSLPRPGEVTLAHRGVLFLDELPEFSRGALEALRQPLEDKTVRISRVSGSAVLPSAFYLVAAANPCPCGWYGCHDRECTCSLGALERYRTRISGPILDRIDLQVRVSIPRYTELRGDASPEPSSSIRARIIAARTRQLARLAPHGVRLNAEMTVQAARATCRLDADAERTLELLLERRVGVTARALDRIVRVARTIADLDGVDSVSRDAVLEAASYRALESEPIRPSMRPVTAVETVVLAAPPSDGMKALA